MPPLLKVRATRVGYYGITRRYPAGHEHKHAGQTFEIGLDALKHKRVKGKYIEEPIKGLDGLVELPSWMEPVSQDEYRQFSDSFVIHEEVGEPPPQPEPKRGPGRPKKSE